MRNVQGRPFWICPTDDPNVTPSPRYHTNVHYQPNLTVINCQANSTATFGEAALWQSSPRVKAHFKSGATVDPKLMFAILRYRPLTLQQLGGSAISHTFKILQWAQTYMAAYTVDKTCTALYSRQTRGPKKTMAVTFNIRKLLQRN